MNKSIFSCMLTFMALACFSFEASAITVSVPTTSTPTVPVTTIPSTTTQPVTVQSAPTTPQLQPSGFDFVPVTQSPSSTLKYYSNVVSPHAFVAPTTMPTASYVLYVSPPIKKMFRYDFTNVNPSDEAFIVDVGPACAQGFRACLQVSIVEADNMDKSSCKLRNTSLFPKIITKPLVDSTSSLTPYRIWFMAVASKESTCTPDPAMGTTFYFVVNCVPAKQVETDLAPRSYNICTP
ncbi:MAG: hypothetical protein K0S27_637 [Gammaproteobacteria bacterium]|jgi:hypothetical protein|nr:hypothetical protein [Gammaproteobacteria bacterium]